MPCRNPARTLKRPCISPAKNSNPGEAPVLFPLLGERVRVRAEVPVRKDLAQPLQAPKAFPLLGERARVRADFLAQPLRAPLFFYHHPRRTPHLTFLLHRNRNQTPPFREVIKGTHERSTPSHRPLRLLCRRELAYFRGSSS